MARSRVFREGLSVLVFAGALLAQPTVAFGSIIYHVSLDTSAFAGVSGIIDFQFSGAGDAATAQVSGFDAGGGTLTAPPTVFGSATGTLPGTVVFDNDPSGEYTHDFNFANFLSFYLTLGGPAVDAPTGTGDESVFAITLYTSDFSANLGPVDPLFNSNGFIRIRTDGTVSPEAAGPSPIVTFELVDSAVPEPSTWILSGSAFLALFAAAGRRAASWRNHR